MDAALRLRVRHLYFVDRIAPRLIADSLALSPQAVRSALVLSGRDVAPRSPAPASATVARHGPDPITSIPSALSRTAPAARRATQRHR